MAILYGNGGGGSGWMKLQADPPGTVTEGEFVDFKTGVPSKNPAFPPQDILTLNVGGEPKNIGCPTALAMVFKANKVEPGTLLRIKYEGKKAGKRGTSFHSFEVSTVEGGDASFPPQEQPKAATPEDEAAELEKKIAAIKAKKEKRSAA